MQTRVFLISVDKKATRVVEKNQIEFDYTSYKYLLPFNRCQTLCKLISIFTHSIHATDPHIDSNWLSSLE